jgi:hypothetical protein
LRAALGFPLIVAAFVLVLVVGLLSPGWMNKDRASGLTDEEISLLKTESRHMWKIPAVWMQVTDATATAASCNGDCVQKTVVCYAPFGIEAGRIDFGADGQTVRHVDSKGWFGWLALVGLELGLLMLAVVCVAPLLERLWPRASRIAQQIRRRFA